MNKLSVYKTGFLFAALMALNPACLLANSETEDTDPEIEPVEVTAQHKQQDAAPQSVTADGQENGQKTPKDPNRGRFLPIPIFITEPAIGEGLGLALAYFHRAKDVSDKDTFASPGSINQVSREQAPPPTVTGVLAAYTSNDTKAFGVGHMNSFRDDHIRFSGMAGLADVNSTFYVLDQPLKFNVNGLLAFQETQFRFGNSKWFWGVGLNYLDADIGFKFELPEELPSDLFQSDITNSGVAGEIVWDTRDNTSMPNRGQLLEFNLWRYDEAIGGDFDYWNGEIKFLSFHTLGEKFVLGLRLEYSAIDGRAPFFAVPWVTLRGIAALRYQGERVAVGEIEGRYNFTPRWALIAFAGKGAVATDVPGIETEQNIRSFGIGGRYKIFEAQNVWFGIDIARGPEDTNWYIQVGHAW